jgi:hypothetical protein
MKFKHGVRYDYPGVVEVIMVADRVYNDMGYEAVVTSLMDGNHMETSKHYTGEAVDLRTRHLKPGDTEKVAVKMSAILGADYDVVIEKTHVHVEYDPRD